MGPFSWPLSESLATHLPDVLCCLCFVELTCWDGSLRSPRGLWLSCHLIGDFHYICPTNSHSGNTRAELWGLEPLEGLIGSLAPGRSDAAIGP